MTSFKHMTVIALALASGVACAANQPFTATNGTVTVDTSFATAGGYITTALGSASYDAATGTLTDPVQAVSTSTNPGALLVDFSDTSGLQLAKGFTKVKLTDFTFDLATNTLFGDVNVGILLSLNDQALLTANTVSSSFGLETGTSVTSSAATRDLGLLASNFTLAPAFVDFLGENGIDPASMTFVASIIKEVKIGTVVAPPTVPAVPEPTSYALVIAGLGLVGMSQLKRRQAK
ncbi:MAG: PEP-CTERM sorting domain-containing protein [Pseudomonadota bacterium]